MLTNSKGILEATLLLPTASIGHAEHAYQALLTAVTKRVYR